MLRLKDIRQIAYNHTTVPTAKLADGVIYDLRADRLVGPAQIGIIHGKEHEVRMSYKLSDKWQEIQSIKVGKKLIAVRDEVGELVLKQ